MNTISNTDDYPATARVLKNDVIDQEMTYEYY